MTDGSGNGKTPITDSLEWYFNNELITWDSTTNMCTNNSMMDGTYPIFQKTTYTPQGMTQAFPAVKILRNLASEGNVDQDVLTLKGEVEVGGVGLGFSTSMAIRIGEWSGTGYYGWITGDSVVTAPTGTGSTATLVSHLVSSEQTVTGFTTKWYREGIDTTPLITGTNTNTVTLTAAQITDNVIIRADFYNTETDGSGNPKVVYSAYWSIDDLQDDEEMYIGYGNNNGNAASLREGQSVTFTMWMGRRYDQNSIDSRYTTFKCKLIDSNNGLASQTGVTLDSDGYEDITQTLSSLPNGQTFSPAIKGGVKAISYDVAHSNGDNVTGIIVAEGSDS